MPWDPVTIGSILGNVLQVFVNIAGFKMYADAVKEGKDNLILETAHLKQQIDELKSDPYLKEFNQARVDEYRKAVDYYKERIAEQEEARTSIERTLAELKQQAGRDELRIESLQMEVARLEEQLGLLHSVARQAEDRKLAFEAVDAVLASPYPPSDQIDRIEVLDDYIDGSRHRRALREATEPILREYDEQQHREAKNRISQEAEQNARAEREARGRRFGGR